MNKKNQNDNLSDISKGSFKTINLKQNKKNLNKDQKSCV